MPDEPLTRDELEAFERLLAAAAERDQGPYDPPRPEFQLVRLAPRMVQEIRRLWAAHDGPHPISAWEIPPGE